MSEESTDKLLNILKKPTSLDQLCIALDKSKRSVFRDLKSAKKQGYNIKTLPRARTSEPAKYIIEKQDIQRKKEFNFGVDDGKFRIGISSDYHINDFHHDNDSLKNFYELMQDIEVDLHIFAGDLVAGQGVYKGQNNDLRCWGYDSQLEGALQDVPDLKGIPTYAIGGNHDASFMKSAGADIMRAFCDQVDGWKNMGIGDARLFLTDWIAADVHHNTAGGGAAYAISYAAQKYLRTNSIFDSPDIFIQGHWHRLDYYEICGIKAFEAGTFQRVTDYAKNKGFGASVGGILVEFDIIDERIDENSMIVKMQTYKRDTRRIPWDTSNAEYVFSRKQKVRHLDEVIEDASE